MRAKVEMVKNVAQCDVCGKEIASNAHFYKVLICARNEHDDDDEFICCSRECVAVVKK